MNEAIDTVYTDKSLYEADEFFNQPIKERMGELIAERCLAPVEAAKKVGISSARFHKWIQEDELFRNFILGQECERNAKLKCEILDTIEEIEDPDKKQKALMEYLKHTDKEFGANYVRSEGFSIKTTVNPAGFEKIREMIDRARVDISPVTEVAVEPVTEVTVEKEITIEKKS